jgi:hypothetical protein
MDKDPKFTQKNNSPLGRFEPLTRFGKALIIAIMVIFIAVYAAALAFFTCKTGSLAVGFKASFGFLIYTYRFIKACVFYLRDPKRQKPTFFNSGSWGKDIFSRKKKIPTIIPIPFFDPITLNFPILDTSILTDFLITWAFLLHYSISCYA